MQGNFMRNGKRSKKAWPTKIKTVKLSREAKRLISYWRDSLLEGEREGTSRSSIKNSALKIGTPDFLRAHCSPEIYHSLINRLETNARDRSSKTRASEKAVGISGPIPVIICPLRFRRDQTTVAGPPILNILWLPAMLLPSGILQPPNENFPWIAREVLEPSGDEDAPVIGSLKALEEFSIKRKNETWGSWESYLKFADMLLRNIARSTRESLEVDGYDRLNDVLIVADQSLTGWTLALIQVLDDVLGDRVSASVLAKIASLTNSKPVPFRKDKWILGTDAGKHLGHFTDSYPLTASQRLAIHRSLELRGGEMLTITGPPGTGKTTVLQSMIATVWVDAAIRAIQGPPIVVCTGATNQSVMNIIDCFERSNSDASVLGRRWLPKVHSYGTYCCSAMKADEVRHYQLELKDGTGLSQQMETAEYLAAAEKHFLDCFQEQFKKRPSTHHAAKAIHQLLLTQYRKFFKEIVSLSCLGFLSFLQSLWKKERSLSYDELFEVLPKFDTEARHQMFQLATHYWEARWLLTCQSQLTTIRSRARERKGLDCYREAWQRRAMVTPAFVATLAVLPRFFPFQKWHRKPPIDLLICDEAGQIPVEMGAPILALADRAIIVGDCFQLEPFWTVQPHLDRSNLHRNKLAKVEDHESWRAFSERGLLASNGSLMKLAINSASQLEDNERGIFLSEQRRSVPELVEYANVLAYGNRLRSKRASLKERPFPAFGYVHIPGTTEMLGFSKLNRLEAREIINWFLEREQKIREFYNAQDLCDVVAIITPFAAQNRELRRLLPKRFARMIVGTVGGLQGAEREIILFSSVYDDEYQDKFFFDQGLNMLNVAVSRARDSFIVFGNMEIFDAKAETPSGILARFLYAHPGNELPPAISGQEIAFDSKPPNEEVLQRLSTLEEHVHTLREAFLQAREEVFLVSPTISSPAIESDRIPDLIRDCIVRGVKVSIFTDYDLNRKDGVLTKPAARGIDLLKAAGAETRVAARIHNKSLAIDSHTLVEGSFNWLSANRSRASRYQKHETSWVISGPKTETSIRKLKNEIAYRLKAVDEFALDDSKEEF